MNNSKHVELNEKIMVKDYSPFTISVNSQTHHLTLAHAMFSFPFYYLHIHIYLL